MASASILYTPLDNRSRIEYFHCGVVRCLGCGMISCECGRHVQSRLALSPHASTRASYHSSSPSKPFRRRVYHTPVSFREPHSTPIHHSLLRDLVPRHGKRALTLCCSYFIAFLATNGINTARYNRTAREVWPSDCRRPCANRTV